MFVFEQGEFSSIDIDKFRYNVFMLNNKISFLESNFAQKMQNSSIKSIKEAINELLEKNEKRYEEGKS